MFEELKKVQKMSEPIAAISQQSSAGNQEVAASVKEATAGLLEILNSASMLANMAGDLKGVVQQFKL